MKIHGTYVPVRAEIVDDQDFSVHADADETLRWLRPQPEPARAPCTSCTGSSTRPTRLADRIDDELGWCAVVPRYGERVRLGATVADEP